VLSIFTPVSKKEVLFMHNDFTLLVRTVPSGKTVVYYYAYNEDGKRLGPWTTGQPNKTTARNYCMKLMREGNLIPLQNNIGTFEELAVDFWDWEKSPYLVDRRKRNLLTEAYADKCGRVVEYNIAAPLRKNEDGKNHP
jgi:hypothetical protein